MRVKSPEKQLPEIIHHATKVFCIKGYRQTQMSDIAKAMGIAVGTLYLYVDSKEALFDLIVRQGFNGEFISSDLANGLPFLKPKPGATIEFLQKNIIAQSKVQCLEKALLVKQPQDVRSELTEMIKELWDIMMSNRWGLFLINKSAVDFPELSEFFITNMRRPLLTDLTAYLEKRTQAGLLINSTNPSIAAILIVETIMWAIVHRLCDPEYQLLTDDEINQTVSTSLVNAFVR